MPEQPDKDSCTDLSLLVWEHQHAGEDRRMPLDDLSKTIEFGSLTKKQKLAVATYISNGYDIVNAIRTAYPCKNDEIASIMQHRFFASPSVVLTLCRHFGTDPKEAFLTRLVKDIIKGKISPEQIRLYEIYANANHWLSSPLLEAAKLAQSLGYKSTRTDKDTTRVDHGNLKRVITTAIRKGAKAQSKKGEFHFDLSDFKDK
jgi:hypothetical protein